jgi:phosphatidylinositol alpha-1,6-mannosyltransferase
MFTYTLLPETIRNGHAYQVIPNGIDIQELEVLDQASLPTDLQGNPSLLTVGNVTPRKGQHRVIKALPEIIRHFPQVHYHIVGLPTNKKELSQLAEQLGVSSHVTFHGQIQDRTHLASYYKGCDIFIMLSENQPNGDVEGFGIAILEANFFGKPAIGAKGCGIEEAIRQQYNGSLVEGNNPEEIVDAIKAITNHTIPYQIQARIWSRDHDWNNLVDNMLTDKIPSE